MKLYIRQIGSGDRNLIIVHGLYGSSDNWLTIAKMLENHFRIFLIDQRNHGRSHHTSEMNYTLMADDLKELMTDNGITKAVIMGHSMGGKTAMRFALKYPEAVDKLVVVDIAPKSYGNYSNYAKITNNHRAIINGLLAVNPNKFNTRNEIDVFLKGTIPNHAVRSFLLKNIGRSADKKMYWKLNLQAISENLTEIMDGFSGLADDIAFPNNKEAFFINGANSPYIQEGDVQQARHFFPSAQFSTIANAGHWLHAEQPEAFVKTVKYFLDC